MKSSLKKFFILFGIGLLALVAVLGIRTGQNKSRQLTPRSLPTLQVDSKLAAEHLSGAIQIQTISRDGQSASPQIFSELRRYLEKTFPLVHRNLKREMILESQLWTWQGKDPSRPAIIILAHQDVVPIAPGSENLWDHPPFAGVIQDGFIWGRGAWDNKGNMMSILEATELLLKAGFQPEQTVYLAFGHNEELGTTAQSSGAKAMADALAKRGAKIDFVMDEGLLIMQQAMKGIDAPMALIGIAEKGYATLKLTATAQPGHSSMPPTEMAISELAEAIMKLKNQPFEPMISAVPAEMFETMAPETKGINRVALSNLWLFGGFVRKQLEGTSGGRAMLRTTQAFTVLKAGEKENVLPALAEALVNFRTLPGVSSKDLIDRARAKIKNDKIQIEIVGKPMESSPISRTESSQYQRFAQTIKDVFPTALVTPGLMTGATDSHFFLGVADKIFRFSPVRAMPEDLARFHGTNERISIENYAEMIRFYHHLLGGS